MKHLRQLIPIMSLLVLNSACGSQSASDLRQHNQGSEEASLGLGGNGAPAGAHFNLNIIGVSKEKSPTMDGGGGNRIFLPLAGKSKILLQEGSSFAVLDANGTDGSASFQMPNPDPENDGITEYSVYARALGKPGGSSTMTPCAIAPDTDEEICSLDAVVSIRAKGKSSFNNVSAELLYITADIDGDGDVERVNIFNDALEDYFWSYDNKGLKLLQLRFYPVSTQID